MKRQTTFVIIWEDQNPSEKEETGTIEFFEDAVSESLMMIGAIEEVSLIVTAKTTL